MVRTLATGPASPQFAARRFRQWTVQTSRWAEEAGCEGILIFTDHAIVDPWPVAHAMLAHTSRLVPLVAAQPPYLHPYTVARMVATLGYMYDRRVDLNLVAGGAPQALAAIGGDLEHDERYDRLTEYGEIICSLLTEEAPVTVRGRHYQVARASLQPRMPPHLATELYVAGASAACCRTAATLGAVRLSHPPEIGDRSTGGWTGTGIRIGVIARDTSEEAWRVARQRFPRDEAGERIQDAAATAIDADWHRILSGDARRPPADPAYWLYPFRAFKEFCPYLVGSREEVAMVLSQYLNQGITTIILQTPRCDEDLPNAQAAITQAERSRC
jgi:alkanesulfonate monooxygenase